MTTTVRRPLLVGQTYRAASGKTRLITQLLPERNGQAAAIQYRDHKGRHMTTMLPTFREWVRDKTAERVEPE